MSKNFADQYNVPDITAQFNDCLAGKGVSKISRKNYLSDLRLFLGWLGKSHVNGIFTLDTIIAYKKYRQVSRVPVSSINRSLSVLRAYGDLLVENRALFTNPARMVSNLSASIRNANALVEKFSASNELSPLEMEVLREFVQTSYENSQY